MKETTDTLKEGDKLKMLVDIYDDGADHHPPGYYCRKGDVVFIRSILHGRIYVSHENVARNSFSVEPGEYEPIKP